MRRDKAVAKRVAKTRSKMNETFNDLGINNVSYKLN